MTGSLSRRPNRKRGQAMVEFALVIPIFLLLLAGLADFGFALFSRMTVINAARDGARAAVMVSDHAQLVTIAQNTANSSATRAGLAPSSVTVTCLQTTTSVTSPPAIACSGAVVGDSISVSVNYTYHTFFPLFFGATFNLGSTVQMVIDS
jgi:Flp pilus assembly protein TadG